MASMQIQTQSQVFTFYVSEAFFDLHTALINRHDFCWAPLDLRQVTGK
jgi:hypothetical protein